MTHEYPMFFSLFHAFFDQMGQSENKKHKTYPNWKKSDGKQI